MKKLLLITAVFMGLTTMAQTDLIISEYVEGWSNNKALEVYNPTSAAINLSEYRVTRYSNGADVPPAEDQWGVVLPDFSLEPYRSYVIVLDKRNAEGSGQEAPIWSQLEERADAFLCPVYDVSKAMYFNGDDGVALEKTDGTLVDLFARWGAPRPAEATVGGSTLTLRCWTDTPPHFDGTGLGITSDHTLIKKSSIADGVTTNPTIWNPLADWDSLPANTFSQLGWHKFDNAPANETPTFGKNEYKFAIASDSENETVLGTITSTDKENDAVKYYIEYGNFIYVGEGDDAVRVEPFELGKTDGILKLVDKTGLVPTAIDTFNIKVVATDGFSQTGELLVQVLVDGEVGVSNTAIENQVSVWPNPTHNQYFNIKSNKEIAHVSVLNMIGQSVHSLSSINQTSLSLSINNATNGVYFVKITHTDKSISTTKILFKE